MSESMRYRVEVSQSADRGRPRFLISRDQLEYLRSLSFTWTEIATLIGVSRMTIFRRRQEFGMLQEPVRTLTDSELQAKLSEIRRMFPEAGEMILGQLRPKGYQVKVTTACVCEALRCIDPINTVLRWQEGSQLEDLILFWDLICYGILLHYRCLATYHYCIVGSFRVLAVKVLVEI